MSLPDDGSPGMSLYGSSKAAINLLTKAWAAEYGPRGVRVNAVSPGVIKTPGHEVSGATKEQINGFFDFSANMTPLGRTGRDDEIAKVVAFLASDDSSFMTGSEVFVDGGIAQV